MKLASEMQLTLVPRKLPQNGCFEVDAIYQPHFGVGGDYYDCFRFSENKYLFVVADISGKGLAAALLMANFQANLRAIIRQTTSPEEFIQNINRAVQRITKSDKYLTLFVCDFDTESRRLRYINAGHIPPLMLLNNEVHSLKEGCTILGYFKSLPSVEIGEMYIEDEALLVIFTDGITDVKSPQGNYFNENMLGEFALKNKKLKPTDFNKKLMRKIDSFKGGEDYPDDVTVLTCRFFKKNNIKKEKLVEMAAGNI
jgi:sigma-B regulation protein RsbU (phosphoserine phosphatase)